MTEQLLLKKLKDEQAKYALSALQRPNQRDSFEYGYHVGTIACYERAINLLLTILDEERNDDPDL